MTNNTHSGKQYVKKAFGKIVICDLDGTVADLTHRRHFVEGDTKDWESFFAACTDDRPFQDIIDLLWAVFHYGTQILYVSGRSDVVKTETKNWLAEHGLPLGELRMRRAGDYRPDHDIKPELIKDIKPDQVWFILDDRQRVVDMWRKRGFRVLQVAEGDF